MTNLRSILGRNAIVLLTAFLLALTLSACGGDDDDNSGGSANSNPGGGSDNNPPPAEQQALDLTKQNAKDVSRAALSATQQERDQSFPGYGGSSPNVGAPARRVTTDETAAARTKPELCSSGNFSVESSGAGRTRTVTLKYSNCTVKNTNTTINGQVTIDFDFVDKNKPQINDDWETHTTFTCDFTVSDNGVPESCHDTYSYLSGYDATGDQRGQGHFYLTWLDTTYRFDEHAIEWTSDGTYYTTSDKDHDGNREFKLDGTFSYGQDGAVTVTTNKPFELDSETGKLTQGEIVITGANGSQLVLSATDSGDLRIQLDANGDGDYKDQGDFEEAFGYTCFLGNGCAA